MDDRERQLSEALETPTGDLEAIKRSLASVIVGFWNAFRHERAAAIGALGETEERITKIVRYRLDDVSLDELVALLLRLQSHYPPARITVLRLTLAGD